MLEKIYKKVPDLIINNAGFGAIGFALERETERSLEILEVNAAAVLEISLESARALYTKGKKGVIMNISSVASFYFMPYMSVYSASKAFVSNFSQGLDEEMKSYGIRILSSCPGRVYTEFRSRASDGELQGKPASGMDAQFAANEIWKQIVKRKPIWAFDSKYRLTLFLFDYIVPKRIRLRLFHKNWGVLSSKMKIIPVNYAHSE